MMSRSCFYLTRQLAASALLGAALLSSVHASVVVEGTRVVYPANEREVTVRMNNKGHGPVLMQAWVDRGNPQSTPQTADAPFLVTPPIFRLDASKGQTVRIAFTGDTLPQDRETLFWFNTLEVPAMPSDSQQNVMQIAIRSRFKLFYRPTGLQGDLPATVKQVKWQVVATAGGGFALRGDNPGAFHVSYSTLHVEVNGKTYDAGGGMIPPFASHEFPLADLHGKPAGGHLRYVWISDYGPAAEEDAQLN